MTPGWSQCPHLSQRADATAIPATTHTDPAKGMWQGSHKENRRSPVLHLQVFITKASTPQPSQTT
jgi:hypothetical protein